MVIKLFSRHSILTCICILAAAVAVTMAVNFIQKPKEIPAAEPPESFPQSENASRAQSAVQSQKANTSTVQSAAAAIVPQNTVSEMRAVWVPYMSLDMSKESDKSESAFRNKFSSIVAGAKSCGMNTLIVHVRPFGDALYKSSYFPWSHTVGGTQGVDPGYDPLKIMVELSHKSGMKLHAWVNPLRIQISGIPSILAQNNLYTTWKNDAGKADWVVDAGNGKFYNPAYPQVRKTIADGTAEIAKNYDVDGIQFDDYFYPTQDASFDKTAYAGYTASASKDGTPLTLADWRRANINALVAQVYSEIKSVKPNLPFGIAPQGNIDNDMNMGADVKSWCSVKGYVDYICPQLYVNFENPVLPYNTAVSNWRKLVTVPNLKLYFGLAVYKAGSDVDNGTWKKSNNILAQQVEFGRKSPCDGFMFYSWEYLNKSQTKDEVQNVMKVLK
ncbi:MAG TPA: family 10 glycosylhydrolase [Caproiciproducens sp.]|nr:family 10 glycosylhydrolase [Caproiciproducens sp.]